MAVKAKKKKVTQKRATSKKPTKKKVAPKAGAGPAKKAVKKKAVKKLAAGVSKKSRCQQKEQVSGSGKGAEPVAGEALDLIVNLATVLALFGVTRQAVDKWKKADTWPVSAVVGRDQYDLRKIFVWYKTNNIISKEYSQRSQKAKVEKEEAGARIQTVKADMDEGKVVEISKVNKDVAAVFAFVVSTLEGFTKALPGKLARKNEKQMVPILRKEVRLIREHLGTSAEKIGA